MYNDQHYKQDRPYFCVSCHHLESESEQRKEAYLNNDADNLSQIPMGQFIEDEVAADLRAAGVACTPVSVRVVSSLLMTSYVPERLVHHQQCLGESFPSEFPYKSKALLAFQKIDGLDVCLFALYVQEYGSDCPEPNKNRVYISYLDSVRYFESEPGGHRSTVYHSVLVAYLEWTRRLGFKHVHIWVEPPKMGDEYIFFARSDQQRKPMKREKLREWYRRMLEKAKVKGTVDWFGSMNELYTSLKSVADIPLFHGDQWELTVPSLLGIDAEDVNYDPRKVDPLKLTRMDAKDVVQKAQQEMQHLKRHFLVVVFTSLAGEPAKDEDPVISTDLTDSRQTFLGQCQMCHWQFNTLRHAQYSTMMILNHIHNKPSYCVDACSRGRVEDGSFMVGCDMCDNWYHGDCVGVSKEEANTLDSYLCPNCVAATGLDEGQQAIGNGGGGTFATQC
jgi:E1A/CREB-binding protein